MTNSSAPDNYSITLNDSTMSGSDVITITSQPYDYITTSDTITLDLGAVGAAQTITLTSDGYNYSGASITGISAVDLSSINNSTFEWISPIPFETDFPNWEDFKAMRKEYPGLEQAYEKLKTFYDLCKDEWEHKKKEQK